MNDDTNCWIDSVIKEHKKQLDTVNKSKSQHPEIDQKCSINNCIFSENDLKISAYASLSNEKILNNAPTDNEQPYSKQSNRKECSKPLETLASSNLYHDDKDLIAKLQKKKSKIAQLREALVALQKENESLKAKDTIPIPSNDDVELMRVQLNQYEMRLEENSNQYLYQISLLKNENESYLQRLGESEEYINIVNAFFRNITGLIAGIKVNVFDITELTDQLNNIGDFLSQLIKENAAIKVKYHKLLEMNSKLVDYDIEANHKVAATGDGLSTFQSLSYVDNVFDLNKGQKSTDDHEERQSPGENVQSPMITVDIYKTLEQRVNMLEKELNMQKLSSGGTSTNSYTNPSNQSNVKSTKTITIKTDQISNKRSKSSNRMEGNTTANTNGNLNVNSNGNCSAINICPVDKPMKKAPKKKKKAKGDNKHLQAHKSSVIITANNQRSVTPINSRKSAGVPKVKSK